MTKRELQKTQGGKEVGSKGLVFLWRLAWIKGAKEEKSSGVPQAELGKAEEDRHQQWSRQKYGSSLQWFRWRGCLIPQDVFGSMRPQNHQRV
jgi:hypothetical protein